MKNNLVQLAINPFFVWFRLCTPRDLSLIITERQGVKRIPWPRISLLKWYKSWKVVATTEESVFFFLRRRLLASCLRCSNVSVLVVLLLFPDPVRPFPDPVVVWPPEATEVLEVLLVVLPFSESFLLLILEDFCPTTAETEVAPPTCCPFWSCWSKVVGAGGEGLGRWSVVVSPAKKQKQKKSAL